jgi:tRNA nucleotidyltransferase (CCA-adding enzyme)
MRGLFSASPIFTLFLYGAGQSLSGYSMDIYIVGGAVRDTLLGHTPKDRDFVVVGSNESEMLAAGYRPVGKDFPVFLHPETHDEYALARLERKSGHGYSEFTVRIEDVTLEEDLSRRDLTINSMAMTTTGELVDPFGGASDLANRVLRHTTLAFCEDPLRVLRVARFLARFGPEWRIAPDTQELIHKMVASGETNYLTPERVWKELEKGLMEPHPVLMLQMLKHFALDRSPAFSEYRESRMYSHQLARAAVEGAQLEERFALAFSRSWNSEEAKQSRIPSAPREVSAAVVRFLQMTRDSVQQPNPELLLELLLVTDALRQKERFAHILAAVDYLNPQWSQTLREAQLKTLSINPQEAIQAGMTGPEKQASIRAARLAALAA